METTEKLFSEWVWRMSQRWVRLNITGKVVQQDFGPVHIRMDAVGVIVSQWHREWLPFLEQARKFIKETIEEQRHIAAKANVSLFESELQKDLAESEFLSEEEAK